MQLIKLWLTARVVTSRHGAQNAYDGASKQALENEFGTANEDDCMIKILERGTLQETEVRMALPFFVDMCNMANFAS